MGGEADMLNRPAQSFWKLVGIQPGKKILHIFGAKSMVGIGDPGPHDFRVAGDVMLNGNAQIYDTPCGHGNRPFDFFLFLIQN
jgi:hypothetical protein